MEKKNADLSAALEESEKESTVKKLQEMRLHSEKKEIVNNSKHFAESIEKTDVA